MPFEDIKSALILWFANQSREDIEELKTFGHELRKKGINITFLAFHPIKKLSPDMQPNELHQLCCKGDFNLFEKPKSNNLLNIINNPFDLLINGCLEDNKFIHTICAMSKAKFRIGVYNSTNNYNSFYELLIKPNGVDLCENYLIEIGKNLKKITK